MILSGEKKEEYRAISKHWQSHLVDKQGMMFKPFTHVKFYNGGYYSDKLPNFTAEIIGMSKGEGREEWGAELGQKYFVISLGEIINRKNC